jgi:hypothetical protein
MNVVYIIGGLLILLGFIYLSGYIWTKACNNAEYDFIVDKMTEEYESEEYENKKNKSNGKEI